MRFLMTNSLKAGKVPKALKVKLAKAFIKLSSNLSSKINISARMSKLLFLKIKSSWS